MITWNVNELTGSRLASGVTTGGIIFGTQNSIRSGNSGGNPSSFDATDPNVILSSTNNHIDTHTSEDNWQVVETFIPVHPDADYTAIRVGANENIHQRDNLE